MQCTVLLKFIGASLLLGLLSACHDDNLETLESVHAPTCDTMEVSFSGDIQPILNQHCIECHSAPFPHGRINLEHYEEVLWQAEQGTLVGSVAHKDGYLEMPYEAEQLPECEIQKIKAWVRQGMEDN